MSKWLIVLVFEIYLVISYHTKMNFVLLHRSDNVTYQHIILKLLTKYCSTYLYKSVME